MELELYGKVALITGANRGIGAAVATVLAREGMHVCLVARDQSKLAEIATRLTNTAQVQVQTVSADLRDPAEPARVVDEAVARFGQLDLLVNNAGATKRADFFTLTDEDWQDGFALKFHGYVRMTRAAWPHLRRTRGSIVNIVGIGARAGSAEFTIGGSVNVALLNFTKAMADIGVDDGVRVNAINPGLIETDRFSRNIERVMRERTLSREEALSFLLQSHGTKRVGRPEEIGQFVAYLASLRADFIQGAIVDIDGGANRAL
ncbi:MAG TPA: SDR family oxidoreductase [Rhodopila sp.]|uniref:SDR family oxidoreductase n=1 Tax=Rhodopila sp. TaxID=2480087 RepID=UPI002B629B5C|nr:SDR family oxidoreductase [Rhodopila sp.]HVY17091.1 SDR family oxidoreductase [Rhodopila sp.]